MNECLLCRLQKMELEISGYVSDREHMGHAATSSSLGSGVSPSQAGESRKQSVSSWVRSAQALLQTPQKPTDRQSKTPEDSGKKKRKFQRFDGFFRVKRYKHVLFPSDVKNNKSMHVALILPHKGGGKASCCGNVSMAKIMSKRTPGITCGR